MRNFLDKLYLGAGMLAGLFIVLITLMILAQIIGRWFGVLIPSTEDFAGFFLAAATFLALAYTFRMGGHIRVTILVHLLKGNLQKVSLALALIVFIIMVAYGTSTLGLLCMNLGPFMNCHKVIYPCLYGFHNSLCY